MDDQQNDSGSLEGQVCGHYKLGKKVAAGAFGAFHLGIDMKNPERKVGIKCEMSKQTDTHLPQLHIEYVMYQRLNEGMNVPKFIPKLFYYYKINDDYDGLVMELLGPSLKSMANLCGGTFSIATTAQILMQQTNMMEYVHERKLLYRDVKPDNFLLGLPNTDRWCTVMLIDLGFAKTWVDAEANRHIKWAENKPLAGTMRFASANNQQGFEIGRRDDLEALLYQAVFLFKGDLPWEHEGKEIANDRERNRHRAKIKESIDPMELCAGMPRQFAQYLTMVRPNKCGFEERPPYRKLIGLMRDVLTHLGLTIDENFYDWDKDHKPIPVNFRS